MENELKDTLQLIVNKLGDIDSRLLNVENNQEIMKTDIVLMKTDIVLIKDDINDLKEDSQVTRAGVNQLLEWADDASVHDVPISKVM